MKTAILFKDTLFVAPLKSGTRTLRAYIGYASNKSLLDSHQDNKYPAKATTESRKFTYYISSHYEYDTEGVENYNKLYKENLFYRDFEKNRPELELKTKILMLRDPVSRFISAYSMMRTNLQKNWTIQEFIDNFDRLMWEYDHHKRHFIPMTYGIGLNPAWYTHIYTIKQIDEIKKHIEQLCGYELPSIHANQGHNIAEINSGLTPEQIDWIKQRYIIDYRVYGKYFS